MDRLSEPNLFLGKSGFLLLVVLSIIFTSCSDIFSPNEITIYPLLCVEDRLHITEGCNGKWVNGNRVVYKIFPENQEVVYYYPGISPEPLKVKNCVIADKNNWRCTYSDKYGSFGCRDGKYYTDPPDPKFVYISKWRWWYLRLIGYVE